MSIRRFMASAAGGLVIALAASPMATLQAQGDLSADSKFIREVASDNLLEIRLGDMARKKATNDAVRQFGERMVTDHTRLLDGWRGLVKQSGFPFQPGLNNQQEQQFKQLDKVSGAEFDRAYMTSMVQDHQNAVTKFQTQGQSANSAQVRQLVAADLPVLQQHLSMATQIGSQVGATTNVAVTPPVTTQNPPVVTQNPPVAGNNSPVATQNTQANPENLSADSKFIREALQDNLLEVRLAQLAVQNSSDPQVKQYAQLVANDHSRMHNQWIALASRNGMTLKPVLGPKHSKKADRLEKMSGREFDRAYLTTEVQSLQDYVEYFSKEGRATRSGQVRDLAANDLRSLELHLNNAKDVGSRIGVDVAAALRARHSSAYRKN